MAEASALPAGFRREAFESLPSTNSAAFASARDGDPGRLWVTPAEQTAGRGRRGRAWETRSGNLAASLLLIDPAPAGSSVATISLRCRHRAASGRSIDLAGAVERRTGSS